LHGAIIRQEVAIPGRSARSPGLPGGDQLAEVVTALLRGRVVPVLGEDSAALAVRLAERFRFPRNEVADVPRVSQYAAATRGYGPLYDELRQVADEEPEPLAIHRFFAALPPVLRANSAAHQLLVTTSYGSCLERAFAAVGEEVDIVSYIASGPNRGKFSHLAPDGTTSVIEVPNTYATELSLDRRTVILKVRGGTDGFVVTEDDYIDYLSRSDVAGAVPVALAAKLRRSHFLFLGYTMGDWNLRVILNRLWSDQPLSYRSWAVQPKAQPIEREFWRRRDVDVHDLPLERYVETLAAYAGLASAEAVA